MTSALNGLTNSDQPPARSDRACHKSIALEADELIYIRLRVGWIALLGDRDHFDWLPISVELGPVLREDGLLDDESLLFDDLGGEAPGSDTTGVDSFAKTASISGEKLTPCIIHLSFGR